MTEIKPSIDWVGIVDWNVRDFHSFHTNNGATYNAYLIRDEQNVVVDTVKRPFCDAYLANIAALCPLDQVNYLVCNHAEPDHAGALSLAMEAMPNATLLCNKKCADILEKYENLGPRPPQIVENGETLTIGKRSLVFVNTPMVHWPESMVTYVPEEKLLFSMDAFGQHLASSHRFDDQVPLDEIMHEAKKYYANIVTPYGNQVLATLKKASTIEIEMIAPSHGVVWRKDLSTILEAYQRWASRTTTSKVLVLYDSMWESTAKMARAILEGATRDGVEAKLFAVRATDLTTLATEMLDASAVAIGSATLNTKMMPAMAGALKYFEGLKFGSKEAMAFGSYGWGRGATEEIDTMITDVFGWNRAHEFLKAQYVPNEEMLAACRKAGAALADAAEK